MENNVNSIFDHCNNEDDLSKVMSDKLHLHYNKLSKHKLIKLCQNLEENKTQKEIENLQ